MGSLFSGPEIKAPRSPRRSATSRISSAQKAGTKAISQAEKSIQESIAQAEKAGSRSISSATTAARTLSPVGFNAGGLSARFDGGQVNVTSSGQRQGLVRSLADRFQDHANKVAELRARVAPGASELRRVRLEQIANARSKGISNLRDNLAQRRVLGSSFAEDALTRAEREFGQAAEQTAAEVEFQELELTNQFLSEEFDLRRQSVATQIGELNIQADLAAGLTAEANATLRLGAQLQAQLAATDANFRASLFNTQTDSRSRLALGNAQNLSNLALGNADFQSNIFQTQSGTAQEQANLDAKAQEGAGSLIGKVAGVALAPATGGASLALTGTSLGLR